MCHRIVMRDKNRFFGQVILKPHKDLSRMFLVGVKEVSYYRLSREFITPHQRVPIKLTKSWPGFKLTTNPPLSRQTISLSMVNVSYDYNVTLPFKMGQHIAPLWENMVGPFSESYLDCLTSLVVLFRIEDLTFFDGKDVSVSKYYVPDIENSDIEAYFPEEAYRSHQFIGILRRDLVRSYEWLRNVYKDMRANANERLILK